ncbi:hypothetical protein AUTU_33510 [Aureibacter tunicatorum]|nr:hypothetical protein AUTU_33510 [Aureibacter tunicatorum]
MALALFAVSLNLAEAQHEHKKSKHTPKEKAEKVTKKMTKELDLNSDQQSRVMGILENKFEEIHAAKKDGDKEKVKSIKNEIDTELKAILTTEQYDKWVKHKEERKKKHKEKGKHKKHKEHDYE